ncbi:hypothetical protein VDGE_00624 [Verticillium dahliae]|uniref:Phosphate metabolism protein n=1 Tax=Verticillium dahliae TaxID=27337 RepID=A0A444S981_VERDA|nr:hypothetical protein VDGE_00624 [Verticillium dahliae]
MDALRFSKRQSQGEARDSSAETASLSGMVSTFVPVIITATVLFTIFLILRRSKRRFYAPRTYLGSLREQERTPALPNGLFNWIGAFWKIPDVVALQSQSLDAYLFLRFLRICATICLVGLLMTWPVLFPVNATGGGGQKELNILSMSNIDITKSSNKNRLYAHAFIGALFYGFVMYTIFRECIFYINLRQAFLLSPTYVKRISSRTVLFTSVPAAYLEEGKLRKLFSDSVKNLWIAGTTKELDDLVEERDKAAMKLEGAEVKLIKAVNKERLKAIKNGASADKPAPSNDAEPGQVAARWIPQKSRPTHRLGKFGLYGKKVDSIDWARAELQRLIPQVDTAQAEYRAGNYAKNGAVFVEFYTQSDAQAAFQVLTHHHALHMSPRYIGITPGEVIWKSLSIPWWQKVVRRYAVTAFITVLILFWAIPVAGVAMISQVDTLKKVSFLTWLDKIPNIILGLVGGLLPSVAMAILMALVPIIMRLCAKIAGEPSASRVELFTQNAYFCFQLIQVFLITTISSSAVAAAQQIVDDPSSVFDILSEALPRSSQFYVSYFIVQGLGIAASVISQVVGFIIFTLVYRFLTSTPRSMYNKWAQLSAISWGSVMPVYTNIAVISIAYAVIAPIMLFWSTVGIGCFYMAYRYNILFVTDTNIDTRGLIYPRALKQLTCGVYLAEICMIGMFSVKKAPGPVVIAVVLLVLTILGHITFASALNPLLYSLPRTLQVEEELLLTGDVEAAAAGTNGEGAAGTQSKAAIFKKVLPGNGDNVVEKRGNIITRWLKPWIFADYHTLRALVPRDLVDVDQLYTEQVEKDAYFPPSVTSATPLLWIPEDKAGVSRDEIIQTSKVIGITDEGCTLDDKNKLQWDAEGARPPIWDEKIYY